jgi:hypothetical protein
LTVWPQLFVLLPQKVPHVVAFESGVQQEPLSHTWPEPQLFAQLSV